MELAFRIRKWMCIFIKKRKGDTPMKLNFVKTLPALACSAVLASAPALAEDKPAKTWELSSELGIIVTSGNTETTTLKGAITAVQTLDKWTNEFKVDGLYKEDEIENDQGDKEKQRTSEKYFASAQGNYDLGEKHSHLYVYGAHTSDYFGAYRNETVLSLGYGKRLFENETMYLNAEIGPGYKFYQYQDDSTELDENGMPLAGEREGEVIALGKAKYRWQISEAAKFTQTVAVEYGDTNTKTKAESALITKINGSMQMKVGFTVINNSDVDAGSEKTDTETSITLVYNF